MFRFFAFIAFTCLLLISKTYGQDIVSGTVFDTNGDTLPSVSIIVKGTTRGTGTDIDGKYSIRANIGDVLIFKYVGLKTQEVEVKGDTLNVTLEFDSQVLAKIEVVEVGYGQKLIKRNVTGAVSEIGDRNILNRAQVRLDQTLQGQISGTQVFSTSGAPGAEAAIRIRGITSNGNNRPLYVVDGIIYDEGLDALSTSDIEKITVLKDASASIYGVLAGNGVVLITTKQGKKNQKAKFDFQSKLSLHSPNNYLDLLNAFEYAVLTNEMRINSGLQPTYTDLANIPAGTDWQRAIFKTSMGTENNLNIRGGSDKTSYSFGVTYLDLDGIIDRSNIKRLTSRMALNIDFSDKFKSDFSLIYTNINRQTVPENNIGSPINDAFNFDPTLSIRNGDGSFTTSDKIFQEIVNPMARISNIFNNSYTNKFSGKIGFTYDIYTGLEITSRFGFNYAPIRDKTFVPLAFYGSGHNQSTLDSSGNPLADASNRVTEQTTVYWNWNWDTFLNYSTTIKNIHKIDAVLGVSLSQNRGENVTAIGLNIPYNSYDFADVAAALNSDKDSNSWQYRNRLGSYFTRINYELNQKYLFSFTLRQDTSSRFGSEKRVGYFPAASVGWILSEEAFLSPAKKWLNFLKFRASWGISGNDKNGGDFAYISLLRTLADYTFGGSINAGQTPRQIENPQLGWEEINQFNVGVDAAFLNNKLEFAVDYFSKRTDGLVVTPVISGIFGTGAPTVNAGSLENIGFEIAATWNQVVTSDINFSLHLNFSAIQNKVLSVNNSVGFLSGGGYGIPQTLLTRFESGKEAGYYFGYKTNGIFQNQAEIDAHGIQPNAVPGDIRFVDINSDNVLDANDRTQIGSPFPDYTIGSNLIANIYNFDLSINIYASVNNDVYIGYLRNLAGGNLPAYSIERWRGENTSNAEPRLALTDTNQNSRASDRYVRDGSFLKIQNVQIGYNISNKWLSKTPIDNIRLYVAAQNVWTLTAYEGLDPEIGSNDIFSNGIDRGFYPKPRVLTFGLNIKF